MIKANVTINGTVCRAAQVRTNKDGNPFTTYGVSVVIPNPNGINKTIELSVIKDGQDNPSNYVVGNRIEVVGELTTHKVSEETTYFNLTATSINHHPTETTDSIKGELHFRGKTGKSIENKTTKNGKQMLVLNAFSAEKVKDGFTYTWVRFVQFDTTAPDWLLPKTAIEAKGDLEMSVYNDRVNFGCRVSELKQYVKPPYNPQQSQQYPFPPQNPNDECPF